MLRNWAVKTVPGPGTDPPFRWFFYIRLRSKSRSNPDFAKTSGSKRITGKNRRPKERSGQSRIRGTLQARYDGSAAGKRGRCAATKGKTCSAKFEMRYKIKVHPAVSIRIGRARIRLTCKTARGRVRAGPGSVNY